MPWWYAQALLAHAPKPASRTFEMMGPQMSCTSFSFSSKSSFSASCVVEAKQRIELTTYYCSCRRCANRPVWPPQLRWHKPSQCLAACALQRVTQTQHRKETQQGNNNT